MTIAQSTDKVIANVERLLALRDAAGTRRPKLILSFVRQNNSEDEHAFIEHWRKRGIGHRLIDNLYYMINEVL